MLTSDENALPFFVEFVFINMMRGDLPNGTYAPPSLGPSGVGSERGVARMDVDRAAMCRGEVRRKTMPC